MKKIIIRILAVLGFIYLLTIVVTIMMLSGRKGKVPATTILEANFEQPLVEDIPETPTAKFTLQDRLTVRDVVDAIDRGAVDDRVKGMVARVGAVPMGMAQTQELREAVARFRSHKKFAIAFAETFGEFGPGNNAYYLATGPDLFGPLAKRLGAEGLATPRSRIIVEKPIGRDGASAEWCGLPGNAW